MNQYLQGNNIIGATAVPSEAGISIQVANAAVRSMKPMTASQGRRLIALASRALQQANDYQDTFGYFAPDHAGANARRSDMIKKFVNIDGTIVSSKLDPIPETAAEILRNAVLAAVAEFNSVAEGVKTLEAARQQFYQDIVDAAGAAYQKAVAIATGAANVVKWTLIAAGGAAGLAIVLIAAHKIHGVFRHGRRRMR